MDVPNTSQSRGLLHKCLIITGVGPGSIGIETCKTIIQTQKHAPGVTWDLILAQRDPLSSDASEAQRTLEILTSGTRCHIKAFQCDLADANSVRTFAMKIKAEFARIHILILNAATIDNTLRRTVDKNEHMYQVNHLGHFLLLSLLVERLEERVIFVSSSLHKKADASATLQSIVGIDEIKHDSMARYAQSKLLTAYCLAKWHSILQKVGVKVILASPGK